MVETSKKREPKREQLTNRLVDGLKPRDNAYNVCDEEVRGFVVRVEPTGRKYYYARYRVAGGRQTQKKIEDAAIMPASEARNKARNLINEAHQGTDPHEKERKKAVETIGAFIDKAYNKELARKRTGNQTYDRLVACFRDGFWARRLDDPDLRNDLDDWRTDRLKAEVSPSTINRDMAALRAALSHAVERGLIDKHPLARLRPLKLDKAPKIRFLDQAEEKRLLNALEAREHRLRSERDRYNEWLLERHMQPLPNLRLVDYADYLKPMVLLSLYTGMRRGEIFSLEWVDVDFERAMLTVRGTVAKSGNTRHIPLNAAAIDILRSWRKQTTGSGLVFPSQTGGRFDNVCSSWERLLKDAEITGFRWHDMRHHFASKLVMAGVDLNTVRELLGHADIKMTLRYAHLAPEHKAAAVARLVLGVERQNVVRFPKKKAASRRETR